MGSALLLVASAAMILVLYKPQYTSMIVLYCRIFICIGVIFYITYFFNRKEVCDEPPLIQIKYFKTIFNISQSIITFYVV